MAYWVWRLDDNDSETLRAFSELFLTALCCAFFGSCAWETFGSAGFTVVRFANLRTAATPLFGDD
ncbi:hypothetical protein CUN61_11825 [Pseudomonas arsenicoxydans]|uniref:Uncharacterized protein n=1 Tax=Pseudomonas arsenicoxydans TaxID=702115 RepID=A0A4P6G223_9PSED|nr:hypothetical protein CUN61_11825 [Pseudomonas arsenicoxydans]